MMRQASANKNVLCDRMSDLLQFRSTHPIQHQPIDGVEWNYILTGTGTETILILSGMLGRADTGYRMVIELEQNYRVLAISYSSHMHMGALVNGLIKLLDREGIQRVHLVGTSLGTAVGHVLVRRYPERLDRMVLSTFGIYNNKKLKQFKQFIGLLDRLPYWAIKKYFKLVFPNLLNGFSESDRQFQIAYLNDLLDLQIDRQTMISQYRMLLDMFENPAYSIDLPIDNSSILIMQSQDDKSWDHDAQAAFRQTYPNAQVRLFEAGGHLRELKDEIEHIETVRHFLELKSA
jgi:pimeloyl-ACP methyl ester carboxylesterase